jgi:hypothetical protein
MVRAAILGSNGDYEHVMTTLHWSIPRLPTGDFTPEDPLAIDYIGQQVGNWLWPGFTSRTSRAGYYLMVCYGLRKVDELLRRHGLARSDENRRQWFGRFERLWAMAICQHYGGRVPSWESIRGLRGVTRTWNQHRSGRLPLEYKLISRQLELAGLGAYLSSLRAHGLVSADSLKPTPIGAALADRMWSEDGRLDKELEGFVDHVLAPGNDVIDEKVGRQTPGSLGRRCRLGAVRERPDLQRELDGLLFRNHPPPRTLEVLPQRAERLQSAWGDGVQDVAGFLNGLEAGTWGRCSAPVLENAHVAMAVAGTSAVLRVAFDRVYRRLVAPLEISLAEASDAASGDDLHQAWAVARERWESTPAAGRRLQGLSVHGQAFVSAVRRAGAGAPEELVEAVLGLHARVERDRGRTAAWISRTPDRLLLQRTGWRSWHDDPSSWVMHFKHGSLVGILADLGRLAQGGEA